MAKKLEHLRRSLTIVMDAFKFVEEICKLKVDEGGNRIVSFDVVSLFTRVPFAQTIQLILEKIYGSQHNCTNNRKKYKDWCDNCQQRFELKTYWKFVHKGLILYLMEKYITKKKA